ncbi:MAG: LysR family transcriptional regulator [Clostridia bacterium]|nr:LysR family transcriptional regulator [Clostridia bacterium]
MDLLQLKYLCTAARFENFSRAAKFHNIPQSAISKTIAQLERELGAQLFDRNGNRVTLNERGKRFCHEVSRALSILGDAAGAVKSNPSLHGELRVLVEEHHGEVMRLLSEFCKENTEVSATVLTAGGDAAEYDLRISSKAALGERTSGERLRDATVQLLLPADRGPTAGERISASQLAGEKQVVLTKNNAAAPAAEEFLRRAGIELPVTLTCDDRSTLLSHVRAGLGVAFVSGFTAREAEEAGVALCRLRENWQYPTRLSYRRALSPVAEAFHALLCERLG